MSNSNLDEIKKEIQAESKKDELTNETVQKLSQELEKYQKITEDLKARLDKLQDVRVQFDKNSVSLLEEFKENAKSIPKQVQIEKRNQLSLNNLVKKFLIWFSCLSFVVMVGLGCVAYYYHENYSEAEQVGYNEGYKEGARAMKKYLIEEMPKASSDWIRENAPEPKEEY